MPLYGGHGLIAEAIEMLKALAEDTSQAAAVYRTLGDLYRQIGLNLLAEARYLKAVELAKAARDVEGQAAVQAGLGEVNAELGKKDEAGRWLNQARAGYEALGDLQRARELQERVTDLSQ